MEKNTPRTILHGARRFFAGIPFVYAQAPESIELRNPLAAGNDLESVLKSVGDWLILIATPIAIFMILVGAFWILVSGGEPDKIKKGKQTILWTLIGYAILLLGTEIANLISGFFSQ
jgi:hypothetical protein